MPAVSCRCRFPSFLYRVYQPTRRRVEASPRACVALCGVLLVCARRWADHQPVTPRTWREMPWRERWRWLRSTG
jgi:hypothetical protein